MIYNEIEKYTWHGEKQDMPGFDDRYNNIVDYILEITEEIWEDKTIELIYDTYDENIIMYEGRNVVTGVDTIVQGTKNTLASFPDRKMKGEAVIWSKEPNGDFYTSHRIGSSATNLGPTKYGPTTKKQVFFRTIADCCVSKNKIFEEWLVRDNLHLVRQLGFDPVEMAKKDSRYKEKFLELPKLELGVTLEHPDVELGNPNNIVIAMFSDIWRNQNFDKLPHYYSESIILNAVCDNNILGIDALNDYLISLANSFSDIQIVLERISSNQNEGFTEVAARWKICGMNLKSGFFGEATGKPLVLPVISHYKVKGGKISEEWMVFDGFDALCQIHGETAVSSSSQNPVESNNSNEIS